MILIDLQKTGGGIAWTDSNASPHEPSG